MKVSEHWIREWVSLEYNSNIIAEQITMIGLKSSYIINNSFTGVFISCIKKIINYTDKLKLCIINDGKQFWQVICTVGQIGQKIAFAKIGTLLPKNLKIINKGFYGIESWGIVCKYSEINLIGVKSNDIILFPKDAPIGFDIGKLKNVIDIEGLPNRSDCLSIRGIARELCAINRINNLNENHIINTVKNTSNLEYSLKVKVPKYCPKLSSRVIESINVNTQTPWWIYSRLQISGIASVDIIVDIINFVMLELGQPINCYDLNNIKGNLTVRMAKQYENIKLLNGQNIKLKEDTLIIADEIGPLNIAGIIGSNRTMINNNTRNILLLSAFFTPSIIAGKASYYGLYTDFAYRYERGVDSEMQNIALERITNLLIGISGGSAGNIINIEFQSYLPNKRIINLKFLHIKNLLGYYIQNKEIEDILNRLGFKIIKKNIKFWNIQIPSWRFDISIPEDIIEELARIYGYTNLPTSNPKIQLTPYFNSESIITKDQIYSQLISRGYQEVITYSFISPKLHKYLQPNIYTPIINNPISKELSVMRSSLWPGLIKALIYNLNRQKTRIALFEMGLVFIGKKVENVKQVEKLGGIFTGNRYIGGWNLNNYKTEFFDIKGDIEVLIRLGGDFNSWKFKAAIHPALHSGKSAKILRNNKKVGWIGALNPTISYYFGLPFEIFIFELDLAYLLKGKIPKFNNVSRFPEIHRDLALLIKKDLSVSKVIEKIRIKAGKYLIELILFDVYADFYKGYNSIALRLTWQHPSRTLFDKEIEELLNNILIYLKERYGIVSR
ncbi:Phenylalanine--tRNA ligase beta subunit [Candidatus Portiera aleyrodidarum]|uniref:Phenylalanine--tRNA ligase beta subunit n=1 Tax=Candidatus Portiera aleyrodidarum TV TaxID=1297582 RepID=A0A8D3XAE6_9GAMM|nr:phenylalanine--tRNA ligase subunit beta [Candidatus Portiera aleyrodidarum]AGI27056.1 phenylalanyl-tRNA synthetase, beta subunit [Candidatus Portiera aleyrodidarum TV]CEI59017.1 Phenylalanine--tRNA ligase beta subunit [Candidatus Portiera aleyrodidarum]